MNQWFYNVVVSRVQTHIRIYQPCVSMLIPKYNSEERMWDSELLICNLWSMTLKKIDNAIYSHKNRLIHIGRSLIFMSSPEGGRSWVQLIVNDEQKAAEVVLKASPP